MSILKKSLFIFIIILTIITSLLIYIKPEITSLMIYQQKVKIWDFKNSNEYFYDENINFSQGQIKLKKHINTTTWYEYQQNTYELYQALHEGDDVTSKLTEIDSKTITTTQDKNEYIDFLFTNTLDEEDIIVLILEGKSTLFYLCNFNTTCNPEDYCSINYSGNPGLHNLTLKGISSNKFRIGSTSAGKIDYIQGIQFATTEYNNTTYYYETGIIETQDYYLTNPEETASIQPNEEGNITYSYSSDSGSTWQAIENSTLNLKNKEKIRIKALLNTNGKETPLLNNITLIYGECIENWNCTGWFSCQENNTQSRSCVDLNECGTLLDKPKEIQQCNYTSQNNTTENNSAQENSSPSSAPNSVGGGRSHGSRDVETAAQQPQAQESPTATPETTEETAVETKEPVIKTEKRTSKEAFPFTGYIPKILTQSYKISIPICLTTIILLICIYIKYKKLK